MATAMPKFKVGQVVMWKRGKVHPLSARGRRDMPLQIIEVIRDSGDWFYRIDRKNCLAESMLRELTAVEKGE
jgi:hypothetical protein